MEYGKPCRHNPKRWALSQCFARVLYPSSAVGSFAWGIEFFVDGDDFVDHTPQPGTTPDKAGVRKLYTYLRVAFPDFQAKIHWQLADGDRVTTYKTYYGTHQGPFLGVA